MVRAGARHDSSSDLELCCLYSLLLAMISYPPFLVIPEVSRSEEVWFDSMARPVETSLPGTPSPPMQSDVHSFCKWVMNFVRFGQYMVVPRGKKVQKILFACIYCSPSAEQIFEPMTDCLLPSLISSLICVPRDYLRKQTPIHCHSICALCLTHADLKQT